MGKLIISNSSVHIKYFEILKTAIGCPIIVLIDRPFWVQKTQGGNHKSNSVGTTLSSHTADGIAGLE
jgi:hypothetical protein